MIFRVNRADGSYFSYGQYHAPSNLQLPQRVPHSVSHMPLGREAAKDPVVAPATVPSPSPKTKGSERDRGVEAEVVVPQPTPADASGDASSGSPSFWT